MLKKHACENEYMKSISLQFNHWNAVLCACCTIHGTMETYHIIQYLILAQEGL